MNQRVTKLTNWHVSLAKTQISLGIHPVWSKSSLSAWRRLGSLVTHWVHNEDSDQTGHMPRLIWVQWAHMPFCWFCHALAHIWLKYLYQILNVKSASWATQSDSVAQIIICPSIHIHTYTILIIKMQKYHIYPKYWSILSSYHTCHKIWKSPFYYLLLYLKSAEWKAVYGISLQKHAYSNI